MIRADMSAMEAALDRLFAQYMAMPPARRGEFERRYAAMTEAGAEWVEIEVGAECVKAVLSDDMRQLCAAFGIDP